jgi:hypothetical protein
MAATDFLTAEVLTFYGLLRFHVLFVIDVATRRVEVAGSRGSPPAKAAAQFVDHYHRASEPANGDGRVRRRERLGGLLPHDGVSEHAFGRL